MDAPPRPVENRLVPEGEYWTVVFHGRVSRVRDAKGFRYLDVLLRHPGEEFHALALMSMTGGGPAVDAGDAGPVLDATAVAAYRARYRSLQEDLAEAEAGHDAGRAAVARAGIDALAEQLAAGLGLDGRRRRAGSTAERARLAVTKAIRSAVRRLDQADPELGRHLDRYVRTGTFCTYAPDPALGLVWHGEPGPTAPSSTPDPTTATAVPGRAAFVGRALERGLMTDLVAAAAAGRGGLMLVHGEAGIGKTRLAEEAMSQATARGMGVYVGRCVETDTPLVWLPLVEALEQLARTLSDDDLRALLGGAASDVARILPSLRRRLPEVPVPVELPAEQARAYLYGTLRDVVLRMGSRRPALLVVEDLHWADGATLSLLEQLTPSLVGARVLAVGTYRDDEATVGTPLARTLERLVRQPACTTLRLGPLDLPEVTELVGSLRGRVPSDDLAQRLWRVADGNPFFVQELCRHLSSQPAVGGDEVTGLPEGVRLLLGHRLQRLSQPCRDVLELVAVLGRDVRVDELLPCVDASGGDTDGIDEAVGAGVLVVRRDGAPDQIGFSHALMREAVLDVPPVRRRRLHSALATGLRAGHGLDAEHAAEIADHLEAAGADATTTRRFLAIAAQRALDATAYEDAAARFRRALALVGPEGTADRARLLAGLGYALRGLGSDAEAKPTWMAALDLLEREPAADPALATELCRALGRYLDATGGLDDAVAVLHRGLRLAGPDPTAARSRLQSALAYALMLHGETGDAEVRIREAAAIADRLDDQRLRADVLASETALHFGAGRLRVCVQTADAAEAALVACGQPWDAVQAQVTTTWPRLWLGDVDGARRHVAAILPRAERLGHTPAVFLSRRSAALLDFVVTGDLARFAAQAAEGVELCRAKRLRWLADAEVFAGLASFWAGDWDEAARRFEAGAAAAVPPIYAGRYSATRLTFLAWAGDGAGFDDVLDRLRATFARMGIERSLGTLAVDLAEIEGQALLGRSDAAAARYGTVRAILDEGLVLRPPDLRVIEALAGLAAALGGEAVTAEAHFDQARRLVAGLPHPRQAPEVDSLHALAVAATDPDRARSLVGDAIAGYRKWGMPAHAARAAAVMPADPPRGGGPGSTR